MDELKQLALLLRKAADIIDKLIEAEEKGVTKEEENELQDQFLLQMMKIQRLSNG